MGGEHPGPREEPRAEGARVSGFTFDAGALIALYERAVGLYASLVGINAYHQPGVEAGKKAAAAVLVLQKKIVAALSREPVTADVLAAAADASGEAFTAWKILEHLAKNGRVARHTLPDASPLAARYSLI